MPDKDKSPKKPEPIWKASTPSEKVDFGAIRHAAHLKKTILKMDDAELKKYSKRIGVPYINGDRVSFLWAAIALYHGQQ
jgi:hypothetical protein